MSRKRIGTVVAAAAALALAGWQQFGGEAAPEPLTVTVPLAAEMPDAQAAKQVAAVEQARPVDAEPVHAEPVKPLPEEVASVTAAAPVVADPCAMNLEVFPEDGAMLGLTLLAPCRADARVVLRHGGLAVAMRTLATGSLFTSIPAMDAAGAVEVRFDDGAVVQAAAAVPELAGLRRFAVQWQDADRFALNGFEGGADYGGAGYRSVATGGVLALGDPLAVPALLAEVYTFPDPGVARVAVEAEVTHATCGRELLGETLYSTDGAVRVDDLTLAMPDCDGQGGFVVLNNPLPDMTLAAAE